LRNAFHLVAQSHKGGSVVLSSQRGSSFAAVSLAAILVAAALAAAPNPIQVENAQTGTAPAAWRPPAVPPASIEGYASEGSVLPGEQLHLHVSTTEGDHYRVEVYRLGWYGGLGARLMTCLPACGADETGHRYGPPQVDPATGVLSAGWPVTDTISVGDTWVTGYYYALLRTTSGGSDMDARGYVPFVVRAPPSSHSQILVQVAVNTWQAYNNWGGKSLYPFNSSDMAPATRVSFERPLAYTAQGPFDWEYNMVRFLEREGYDLSYQTDADTDLHPESLLQHRLVMVIGHDEYWTKRMRDAFDAALAAGTNLAFTNSNAAFWQVRYEDGGRTLVGYKHAAPDPVPDPALRTIQFRELGRPECALVGVMWFRIREHQTGPVDYTVTEAANGDPWFSGTGFKPGETVQDVVGNEWDSLAEPPVPADCVKPGLTVFFHFGGPPQNADAIRYTAPSGARVFASGAQRFSWSLDTFNTENAGRTLPADTRLQQFTRNALADLTRPAPPASVQVTVRGRTATIRLRRNADPRVRLYELFRHAGPRPFAPGDPGVVRFCRTTGRACVLRGLRPGTYRFAAVAVDEWGLSAPTLSATVLVRKGKR
jgi:N,N-dimethylformamidase beta subunit-like, C-terminal